MFAGDAAAMRERHAEFYARLAEAYEPHIYGRDSVTWLERLSRETDNLRSAIEWSTTGGKPDFALRILGSAAFFFWLARVLRSSELTERIEQAVSEAGGTRGSLARARVLNATGFMYWADIFPMMSPAYLEEALAIGRELGDRVTIGTALRNLGMFYSIQGSYQEARSNLEESVATWKDLGEDGDLGRGNTLLFLGDVALNVGEAERAGSVYEEAAAILKNYGEIYFLAYCVRRLGQLAWSAGDFQKALALCRESLEMNQQVRDLRGVCACMAGFAAIAAARGDCEQAAVLAGSVEAQLASLGVGLIVMDRMEFDRTLGHLQAALPEEKLAKLRAKGRALSLEQAIELALAVES
jgi:serine/threonine-protein kinase PknK